MAQRLRHHTISLSRRLIGNPHQRRSSTLLEVSQYSHQSQRRKSEVAQPRMEEISNHCKQQRKRHLHDRHQSITLKKLTQLNQISHDLLNIDVLMPDKTTKRRIEYINRQIPIQTHGKTHHQTFSHPLHGTREDKHHQQQHRKRKQCHLTPASHHPVEEVHHVQKRRDGENLRHRCQQQRKNKNATTIQQQTSNGAAFLFQQ